MQSIWHLRSIIFLTATLTSLGAGLLLPGLFQENAPIPDMPVPFHATAPTQYRSTDCLSHSAELTRTSSSTIAPGEAVWLQLSAFDTMEPISEIRLEGSWNIPCLTRPALTAVNTRQILEVEVECKEAQDVALRLE